MTDPQSRAASGHTLYRQAVVRSIAAWRPETLENRNETPRAFGDWLAADYLGLRRTMALNSEQFLAPVKCKKGPEKEPRVRTVVWVQLLTACFPVANLYEILWKRSRLSTLPAAPSCA